MQQQGTTPGICPSFLLGLARTITGSKRLLRLCFRLDALPDPSHLMASGTVHSTIWSRGIRAVGAEFCGRLCIDRESEGPAGGQKGRRQGKARKPSDCTMIAQTASNFCKFPSSSHWATPRNFAFSIDVTKGTIPWAPVEGRHFGLQAGTCRKYERSAW